MINNEVKLKKKSDWLILRQPNDKAKIRFFCFPFAGGGPHIFGEWSKYLPTWSEVGIIQLPGHGKRLFEPPFKRIEPLIESLSAALIPFQDKPFACFGHSMGAILVFELARFWRKNAMKTPQIIFVSGCAAPHVYKVEKPVYNLPDSDLISELKLLGGTPLELLEDSEMMQLLLPTLRADFELMHHYRYQPEEPFEFPIVAFGGDSDQSVDGVHLKAWCEQTNTEFSIKIFGGDHFFILSQTLPLLEKINKELVDFFDPSGNRQSFINSKIA